MNKVEVAQLLARASATDNRVVTEETVVAWWDILKTVDYTLAVEALIEHQRTNDEYLRPVHITTGARRVRERRERDARIAKALEPRQDEPIAPPPQCEHGKNIARCLECSRRLAAGHPITVNGRE